MPEAVGLLSSQLHSAPDVRSEGEVSLKVYSQVVHRSGHSLVFTADPEVPWERLVRVGRWPVADDQGIRLRRVDGDPDVPKGSDDMVACFLYELQGASWSHASCVETDVVSVGC